RTGCGRAVARHRHPRRARPPAPRGTRGFPRPSARCARRPIRGPVSPAHGKRPWPRRWWTRARGGSSCARGGPCPTTAERRAARAELGCAARPERPFGGEEGGDGPIELVTSHVGSFALEDPRNLPDLFGERAVAGSFLIGKASPPHRSTALALDEGGHVPRQPRLPDPGRAHDREEMG